MILQICILAFICQVIFTYGYNCSQSKSAEYDQDYVLLHYPSDTFDCFNIARLFEEVFSVDVRCLGKDKMVFQLQNGPSVLQVYADALPSTNVNDEVQCFQDLLVETSFIQAQPHMWLAYAELFILHSINKTLSVLQSQDNEILNAQNGVLDTIETAFLQNSINQERIRVTLQNNFTVLINAIAEIHIQQEQTANLIQGDILEQLATCSIASSIASTTINETNENINHLLLTELPLINQLLVDIRGKLNTTSYENSSFGMLTADSLVQNESAQLKDIQSQIIEVLNTIIIQQNMLQPLCLNSKAQIPLLAVTLLLQFFCISGIAWIIYRLRTQEFKYRKQAFEEGKSFSTLKNTSCFSEIGGNNTTWDIERGSHKRRKRRQHQV